MPRERRGEAVPITHRAIAQAREWIEHRGCSLHGRAAEAHDDG